MGESEAPRDASPSPSEEGGGRAIKTKAQRAAALAAAAGGSDEDASPFGRAVDGGAGVGGAAKRGDPSQLVGVEGAADLPAPEPLSAVAAKDAGPIIEMFSEYIAQVCVDRNLTYSLP